MRVLMVQADSDVLGVLLAGGLSRRMGGGDKGLLDLAGKPMIAHALDRIRPQVSEVVLNANGDPQRFAKFGVPVVADVTDGAQGPLAGVLAGLLWARAHRPDIQHIVTASSDAPFLPRSLVATLKSHMQTHAKPIALAASGGHNHPVIGVWPVNLADDLQNQLKAGVRKVVQWTAQHGFVTVDFPFFDHAGRSIDPFFNANTPEELDEARAILQTPMTN